MKRPHRGAHEAENGVQNRSAGPRSLSCAALACVSDVRRSAPSFPSHTEWLPKERYHARRCRTALQTYTGSGSIQLEDELRLHSERLKAALILIETTVRFTSFVTLPAAA